MEIPHGMKRLVLLTLFMACALAAVGQSDLYERYAPQPGVKVASVSNFPLDSVSHVDVVLVEAACEEGWQWMKREFLIVDLLPEQQSDVDKGNDVVFFARRSRSNPGQGVPVVENEVDVASSCYVGISYLDRAVYIFCADSDEQSEAIAALLVRKIMHASR